MGADRLPEPWHSFLAEIDHAAEGRIDLHCIGGFAVSLYYGLLRPTADLDIVDVAPHSAKSWLAQMAGQGSALHKKHRVYLQIVTVASVPESYEDRLTEMVPGAFTKLRLFVLDPYDLALSKLTRNLEVDLDDVKHLVRSQAMDLGVLEDRYAKELRLVVIGPVERHDSTLALWLEVLREERAKPNMS